MTHINFLEPKGFDLRRLELTYLVLFAMTGGMLVSMMMYGVIQKYRLHALERQVLAAQSRTEVLRQSGGDVTTSEDGGANHIAWAPVLNVIIHATPTSVRLTTLKGDVTGKKMDLEGEAVEVEGAVRFQQRLASLSLFRKVLLISSESVTTEDKKKLQRFHLQGELK